MQERLIGRSDAMVYSVDFKLLLLFRFPLLPSGPRKTIACGPRFKEE